MKSKETRYPDYPLFKGLQRPLEVMGLQGRYIYWAAGTAGAALRAKNTARAGNGSGGNTFGSIRDGMHGTMKLERYRPRPPKRRETPPGLVMGHRLACSGLPLRYGRSVTAYLPYRATFAKQIRRRKAFGFPTDTGRFTDRYRGSPSRRRLSWRTRHPSCPR